jgi:hypothetical protein
MIFLAAGNDQMKLTAGSYLKLREDPVEMVTNRAVRYAQVLADFTVGQPVGCQAGDLELLRGQLFPGLRPAMPARLTGGAEFVPGFLGQVRDGKRVEAITRRPQGRTRFHGSPLAAKPSSVPEQHSAPVTGPMSKISVKCPPVQGFGLIVVRDHRSCVGCLSPQERARCSSRQ